MSDETLEESIQAIVGQLYEVAEVVCRESKECVSSHLILVNHNNVLGGVGQKKDYLQKGSEETKTITIVAPCHSGARGR